MHIISIFICFHFLTKNDGLFRLVYFCAPMNVCPSSSSLQFSSLYTIVDSFSESGFQRENVQIYTKRVHIIKIPDEIEIQIKGFKMDPTILLCLKKILPYASKILYLIKFINFLILVTNFNNLI